MVTILSIWRNLEQRAVKNVNYLIAVISQNVKKMNLLKTKLAILVKDVLNVVHKIIVINVMNIIKN